jgi:hypothetical protein
MAKVVIHTTITLDGFMARPNDGPGNRLGDRVESAIRQAQQATRNKNK